MASNTGFPQGGFNPNTYSFATQFQQVPAGYPMQILPAPPSSEVEALRAQLAAMSMENQNLRHTLGARDTQVRNLTYAHQQLAQTNIDQLTDLQRLRSASQGSFTSLQMTYNSGSVQGYPPGPNYQFTPYQPLQDPQRIFHLEQLLGLKNAESVHLKGEIHKLEHLLSMERGFHDQERSRHTEQVQRLQLQITDLRTATSKDKRKEIAAQNNYLIEENDALEVRMSALEDEIENMKEEIANLKARLESESSSRSL